MLVRFRIVQHLLNLCCSHIFGINTTHTVAMRVYLKHDSRRLFAVFAEKTLQNVDNKFHWRKIVVQ